MKKLRFIVLEGVARFGREKSIIEILSEAGLNYSKAQLATATRHLEMLGLIHQIQPDVLVAEVTPFGRELLQHVR
jgi:hypothetical protein